MSGSQRRVVVAFAAWTGLLLVVAILVAGEAMVSLYEDQQACFFNFPAVACPADDDPAVGRLTFAFFGIPALWVFGIIVAIVGQAVRRSRTQSR